MKSAIVTGATGFVGRYLVEQLLDAGVQTTIVVRDVNKLADKIRYNENLLIVEKDIYNLDVDDFDSNTQYDVFYNLAWEGVSSEDKNKELLQLGNINMALRAIDVCNKIGCRVFVGVGTVAEYALCNNIMDVYAKQSPNDFYGASKAAVHTFLEVAARQRHQDFVWTVLPSTYGEGRSNNNIVTYTITSLLQGKKPIYGNLMQMWDFLYVRDVADALIAIGQFGKKDKIYGIGSGQFRRLKDYMEAIRDLIDPQAELGIGEREEMSTYTFSSCVNTFDLINDTGFVPKTSFEEGIKKTICYYKNQDI